MEIGEIIERQREYFASGKTLSPGARMAALKALQDSIKRNEQGVLEALKSDLNKTPFEAYATEVGMVMAEISHTMHHLRAWMHPQRVHTPMMHFISRCRIEREPYGVALIMSPWNYPFQLTLSPLVGAIAGGNCTVVKPSAYSPATSDIIAKIIREAFDPGHICVVQGGRDANQSLLVQRFDYILFTGSVAVGQTVMECASKYLTPVTLELGGKSPTIVCRDANIDLAAKRIIWGKTLNSGQTCVAPDYVLVHKDVKQALIEAMIRHAKIFFGEHTSGNESFPRMVNAKHFERVKAFFSNGRMAFGGEANKDALRLDLTILDGITWDDPVMKEEIFGPVLPLIEFTDLEEVISTVNSHPKPLALYLFTASGDTEREIMRRVSFGGGCVNDTIVHLATSHMPFGGVGQSGMGGYHGIKSFETFTHAKSVLKKSTLIDVPVRYPPYKKGLFLLKKLMG